MIRAQTINVHSETWYAAQKLTKKWKKNVKLHKKE